MSGSACDSATRSASRLLDNEKRCRPVDAPPIHPSTQYQPYSRMSSRRESSFARREQANSPQKGTKAQQTPARPTIRSHDYEESSETGISLCGVPEYDAEYQHDVRYRSESPGEFQFM